MPFSTNADLLRIEPNLLDVATFISQNRLQIVDGVIAGTGLTSATANFAAAGIDAGDIAVVEEAPYEVTERVSAGELTISGIRASLSDTAYDPRLDGEDLIVTFPSFRPQIQSVYRTLLTSLGIDADNPDPSLTAAEIVSTTLLADIEVRGALAMVFEAAATTAANPEDLLAKAVFYRQQFEQRVRSATILVQPGGADAPIETRQFRHTQLSRTS